MGEPFKYTRFLHVYGIFFNVMVSSITLTYSNIYCSPRKNSKYTLLAMQSGCIECIWRKKTYFVDADVSNVLRLMLSGRLHVVFFFGPVFEDPGELAVVKVALFVNGSLSVELVHLFICETISHGGQQLAQLVFVNESCADEKIVCLI